MKRLLVSLLALVMIFALSACSSSPEEKTSEQSEPAEDSTEVVAAASDESESESSKEVLPLEITQFGYAMDEEYLFYAITIHNPNDSYIVELPSYRITARGADGKVVGTEEQTLSIVYPGQDFFYASQGCSCSETPETVDVELLPAQDYNITKASQAEHPEFIPLTVISADMNNDPLFPSILGEIRNDNDYAIDSALVTVFFRDGDGTLVAGELTFVDSVPAHGTAPFEIDCYGGFETENFEVYANIW